MAAANSAAASAIDAAADAALEAAGLAPTGASAAAGSSSGDVSGHLPLGLRNKQPHWNDSEHAYPDCPANLVCPLLNQIPEQGVPEHCTGRSSDCMLLLLPQTCAATALTSMAA